MRPLVPPVVASSHFLSNLGNYHGPVLIDDADIVDIMRGSIFSSLFIDSCGVILVLLSLTDGYLIPFSLIPKEISRKNRNG